MTQRPHSDRVESLLASGRAEWDTPRPTAANPTGPLSFTPDPRRTELERIARELMAGRQFYSPATTCLALVDAILDAGWQPPPAVAEPVAGCRLCHWCFNERCRAAYARNPAGRLPASLMILCPDCGNKRCPRASHHDHTCTRSNASGQAGSVYGDYKLDTSWLDDGSES